MSFPKTTRLRFFKSKSPEVISLALDSLGVRVQIYGCPQFDGKQWVLWFVPADNGADIPSADLDKREIIK